MEEEEFPVLGGHRHWDEGFRRGILFHQIHITRDIYSTHGNIKALDPLVLGTKAKEDALFGPEAEFVIIGRT